MQTFPGSRQRFDRSWTGLGQARWAKRAEFLVLHLPRSPFWMFISILCGMMFHVKRVPRETC